MGRGGVLYNYSFSLFAMKINPKNDKDNFPSIVIKLPDPKVVPHTWSVKPVDFIHARRGETKSRTALIGVV